jgi:hypothetical protein
VTIPGRHRLVNYSQIVSRSEANQHGGSYNTLALAEYRRGRWIDAIAAGERSTALQRGGTASD